MKVEVNLVEDQSKDETPMSGRVFCTPDSRHRDKFGGNSVEDQSKNKTPVNRLVFCIPDSRHWGKFGRNSGEIRGEFSICSVTG